jgi:Uma2 family endonuclease
VTTAARRVHYTYEEYLSLERDSLIKHEYLDGEIFALAGGSPDHAALAAAVIQRVGAQLPPGCRVFTSDLRVRIPASGLSTYPDVTVVCGPRQLAAEDDLAIVNPVLLIEVTSRSTEDYDRGEKLRHYQQLPSLREVMFVSHRRHHLVVYRRDRVGSWEVREAAAGGTMELDSIGARIAVDELYRAALESGEG